VSPSIDGVSTPCRVIPVTGTSPLVLRVTGEVDSMTVRSVMRQVVRASVAERVRLDCSAVTFFGAAGVGMLVRLQSLLGERLSVGPVSPCVQRVLELCDRTELVEAPLQRAHRPTSAA
jgi:anti-anti-sigma factor